MRQRANARARTILAEHIPHPLNQEQETEIDRMARAFQAQAGGTTGL
jgi:hypothetical protein